MEIQGLRSARFVNVHRESNTAAHVLAKEAGEDKVDFCWLEDIPRSISNIVFREQVCP
jgi:hypothetical protein